MKPGMNDILFEIVWTEASTDTRTPEVGLLVDSRIVGVTTLRRRDLTAAITAASNLMRKHPNAHGFYVRRRREKS
jgi:hypothetical protein